jgi:hypothetical protein
MFVVFYSFCPVVRVCGCVVPVDMWLSVSCSGVRGSDDTGRDASLTAMIAVRIVVRRKITRTAIMMFLIREERMKKDKK